MKKIRIAVIALFVVAVAAFGAFTIWSNLDKDETPPVIECTQESFKVSVKDDESVMLDGLTAHDDVDGDLTDSIRVSSISHFAEKGKRTIEYVVFDKANNFATYKRTLQYTDYEPPRIYLDTPLRFSASDLQKLDPTVGMRVEDVLDGNIANKIRISYGSMYIQEPGFYKITAQVSNSAGDTCSVPLEINIVDSSASESQKYYPMLSDYIIYMKAGEAINLNKYLIGVMRGEQEYKFSDGMINVSRSDIAIINHVDFDTPGTYTVDYSYTSSSGVNAVTKLVVVVEE